MGRVGFIAMLLGVLMLIGSWLYHMLLTFEIPLYYRIAIILIVSGAIIILIKQLFDRTKEKKENEEYKQY